MKRIENNQEAADTLQYIKTILHDAAFKARKDPASISFMLSLIDNVQLYLVQDYDLNSER